MGEGDAELAGAECNIPGGGILVESKRSSVPHLNFGSYRFQRDAELDAILRGK